MLVWDDDAIATAGIYQIGGTDRDVNEDDRFIFHELGIAYNFVPPRRFGDPSLFLDFRPTRRWVRAKVQEIREECGAEFADDVSVGAATRSHYHST
jgi:hypothetical protein